MADNTRKLPENVEGSWYVDDECIDCNLCSELAPEHFKVNLQEGYDYVYNQPETEKQIQLCTEAMESCPVDAIGNDG